jgi:hypothetical protein
MLLSILCLAGSTPSKADDIAYTYTFTNGQILPAGQLNTNFNNVSTVVNGNLTNANIKAAAAIALSKLDLTDEALNLRATGNPTWASGITGDTVPRISLYSNGILAFGAGSATAMDIMIKRASSTQLSIRDIADSADEDLKCGVLTAATVTSTTNLKLTNGSVLTFTPATVAADRAITVKDPGAAANQIFSTGSLNTNGALYTDGTNILSTATGGAGTKFLTSVSGAAPTWAAFTSGFGGDGSDGAVSYPSTAALDNQKNATTFAISDGATALSSSGEVIINCTSTCTVGGGASGGITVTQQSKGGAAGDLSGSGPASAGIGAGRQADKL